MAAEIIPFPIKEKNDDLPSAIKFTRGWGTIKGVRVPIPTNGKDYLETCKAFLEPEDYQDILCGIMDREHYDALEIYLQVIIDHYYELER